MKKVKIVIRCCDCDRPKKLVNGEGKFLICGDGRKIKQG